MGRFQKSSSMAMICLLLFLACRAEVPYGDPASSAAAAKHPTVHLARKMLNTTTAAGDSRDGGAAAAVAVTYAVGRITSPDGCSEEVVKVSQSNDGCLPGGVPAYSVTITNTCLDCTVHNVHVACGEFASTELVDPRDFRRLAVGDCLVRDGGPMTPGDVVTFEYSNSLQYPMHVASVACGSS